MVRRVCAFFVVLFFFFPVPVAKADSTASFSVSTSAVKAGDTITVTGEKWLNEAGTDGSNIVIKLFYTLPGQTDETLYTRSGDKIQNHPSSGAQDQTIWLAFKANSDGSFEKEVDLPNTLVAGQKLVLNLTSGLLSGDTQRTERYSDFIVDGVAFTEVERDTITCTPSVSPVQYGVNENVNSDGTLTVWGKGFCNTISGGARIAIKIDEGRISRLNDDVNPNRTIWTIVDADDRTGDWSIDMQLPDGTTNEPNGSEPAFDRSLTHTVRLLVGSLKQGDPAGSYPLPRTAPLSFSIGEYVPNGAPEPVDYAVDLNARTQNAVGIEPEDSTLKVSALDGAEGDWVYPSVYLKDGSVRYPWGASYYKLDKDLSFTLPLDGINLPTGQLKVVLQSGNRGKVGELVGWSWWTRTVEEKNNSTVVTRSAESTTTTDGYDLDKIGPNDVLGAGYAAAYEMNRLIEGAHVLLKEVYADELNAPEPSSSATVETTQVESEPITEEIIVRRQAAAGQAQVVRPVSAASAQASQAPTTTPDVAVREESSLRPANSGALRADQEENRLNITFSEREPGEWVYLYTFTPDYTPLGWAQIDKDRKLELALGALDEDTKVAMASADGDLIGWVRAAANSSGEVASDSQAQVAPIMVVQQQGLTSTTDWLLILGSIILIEALGFIVYLRTRAKKNSSCPTD